MPIGWLWPLIFRLWMMFRWRIAISQWIASLQKNEQFNAVKGERHGSVAERILAANRPVNILGREEDFENGNNNSNNNKGFNSINIKNKGPSFDINKALKNFKNSNVQFSGNNTQVKPPSYPPNKH